jgi:O-antigen/teichoic acid export membrane protein
MTTRTLAGAGVLMASRVLTRGLDLVVLTVLGRLLLPDDFGLVAIAITITAIVEAASELPVTQALLRLPVVEQKHIDTGWTLGFVRGIAIAGILIALARPAATFYEDDRIFALICVLSIGSAVRGMGNPRLVFYGRRLDFRRDLLLDVCGKSVSLVCAILVATLTGSYWAIAVGSIVTPLVATLVSFLIAPYRPRLSFSAWQDYSAFFGWSTAAQITSALNSQMDQLLLGKFIPQSLLGQFVMASNLATLPVQLLITQTVKPLIAAFSLVRSDSKRLIAAYQKSAYAVVAVGAPILVGTSVVAPLAISILVGDKWLPAASPLAWLALAAIPPTLVAPAIPLALCLDRPNVMFRLTLIEFLIKLPLLWLAAMMFGVTGVLVVRVVTGAIVCYAYMLAVRGLIGVVIVDQLINLWRPVAAVGLMAGVALPLSWWLDKLHIQTAVELAVVVGISGLTYILSLLSLWKLFGSPEDLEAKFVGLVHACVVQQLGRGR